MLSDVELNALAGFFPRPHQRLLPVISRQVSYQQEEIYAALRALADRRIVDIVWTGGNTVYSLNTGSDEAADGYHFYVKLRAGQFRERYPAIAGKVDGAIAGEADGAMAGADAGIVLLCGNHARGVAEDGDPLVLVAIRDSGRSEKSSDTEPAGGGVALSALPVGGDGVRGGGSGRNAESADGEPVGESINNIAITREEFRNMKISDAERFREIVNHCIPLKGTMLYFGLLYREIGVL
jgi:Fe2+ or Zn2+ uptake regulation protein